MHVLGAISHFATKRLAATLLAAAGLITTTGVLAPPAEAASAGPTIIGYATDNYWPYNVSNCADPGTYSGELVGPLSVNPANVGIFVDYESKEIGDTVVGWHYQDSASGVWGHHYCAANNHWILALEPASGLVNRKVTQTWICYEGSCRYEGVVYSAWSPGWH